ncbi:hypothetical protein [Nostoc sp. 'Peltigera malacea cyanobiont' DB3992]|uniref:hypothetical protein n=1 Tax=Nostoc sp. 'Peltigera malacea cyanobiont' DB3992 TaxID=1206980 RepID=UPI000C03D3C3|nr:hypothetical protein [Nostoc sp. 'Peltigera malacea cyanobiont' DB3992]PHM09753.1 hypothetical protein CK516_12570 [Nostoc sp. 'Peltigera malacea cyanobiont' DB3992]
MVYYGFPTLGFPIVFTLDAPVDKLTLHYILKCKKWVKAWSKMILGTTINHIRTSNRAILDGSVRAGLLEAPGSFSAKMIPGQIERGAILESTIRLISGLGSAEKTRIVKILQSNIYFLSLEASIQLSVR